MLIDYEWLRQPETLVAVVDTGSLAVKENISFLSWRHLDEICWPNDSEMAIDTMNVAIIPTRL